MLIRLLIAAVGKDTGSVDIIPTYVLMWVWVGVGVWVGGCLCLCLSESHKIVW